uniref:Capsid protein n=1 Tax=Grapevine Algerian latent virus TaxID=208084 RepID=A0A0A0N1Z2_9TOMB|nr:capsid protein [Grapevine Algerian latent virus]
MALALNTRRNNNNGKVMEMLAYKAATAGAELALANVGSITRGVAQLGKSVLGKKKRSKNVSQVGALGGAVVAPVAVTRQIRGSKPKFSGRGTGSITVTHREYLGQVVTTADLQVNGGITGNLLKVNPLNGILFSWLPTIAAGYDQYAFNRLSLQYVPLCATTATGRVAMYWDKDSTDLEPSDRVELANQAILKETSPWAEANLTIPTDRIKRFCDDSAVADRKLVDLGQLGVATYGGTAVVAGDVFVSYTVTFYNPQPLATLMDTTRINTSNAVVTNVGPQYTRVDVVSGNQWLITFRGVGKFVIFGSIRGAGAVVLALSGVIVNSSTTLTTPTGAMYVANVTVSSLPASVSYTMTTVTAGLHPAVRATKANDMGTP